MTRRIAFLIGLLVQCMAIFGLFLPYVLLVQKGTSITLRTVPVDPRSIFRGDYVILQYEAAQDLPENWQSSDVYIVLEPKGEVYERVSFSETKPELLPGQVCLYGHPNWRMADVPSLSQYFVEEGLGLELEQAQRERRLLVTASVSDDCDAVLRYVTMGADVTPEELERWQRNQGILPPPEPMPEKPVRAPVQ